MNILSIDPAKTSGVAIIDAGSGQLIFSATVRPFGGKGRFKVGDTAFDTEDEAWTHVYRVGNGLPGQVVIERGFGIRPTAVDSQGAHYGFHRALCMVWDLPPPWRVNVAMWRRAIAEDQGISWPKERDRCKALSVALASRIWGVELSDDEADAALIGRAALRMGLGVECRSENA